MSVDSQGGGTVKVAVIGGGCAALTAAFELTRPQHKGRYQVTIYQQGWRLGGKGASGRGPADRIEEHGLHLWMGFYENAFRIMRECYSELGRDPAVCRIADWTDAFVPDELAGVMEQGPLGRWRVWLGRLPGTFDFDDEGRRRLETPGDPAREPEHWTVASYLSRSLSLVASLLEAARSGSIQAGDQERAAGSEKPPPRGSTAADLTELMARALRVGELATLGGIVQSLALLGQALEEFGATPLSLLSQFHDAVAKAALTWLERLTARDPGLRRVWELVDQTMAVVRGSIRFRLLTDPRGFDAINDYDCREWLLINGASPQSVDSAFVRGLYDLAFAYEDGDVRRPRIAAGQALRGALRAFFTYRGAFFWKMTSGMGDVVFAPLYQVLRARGVRFEFFHRLDSVGLCPREQLAGADRPWVDRLEMTVQARVMGGREYQPLIDVRGLPCWPAHAEFDQLEDGGRVRDEGWRLESQTETRAAGKRVLRMGRDFDCVVLGVGLGVIPLVCGAVLERVERWRDMVKHCKTVATQAFQLWLKEDMTELGWQGPSANVSGFVEPFDTWADMRQLIAEESWPGKLGSIAYFCSVFPDLPPSSEAEEGCGGDLAAQNKIVRRNAIRFLNHDVVHLWPRATRRPGEFRWELLATPSGDVPAPGEADESTFDSQFWAANVEASDRYSLALPGSLRYRISPLDQSIDNLTVAGDWTDCGFNEGCVEAAVMSGRLAAHAISRSPALEDIVGYDHP